jgi:hypothetical protein
LAGDNPVLDTTKAENDIELKSDVEESKLHRIAKVHDFLEKWWRSQNLRDTLQESHAQNKQMSAVGYISDTAEIVGVS